MKSFRGLLIGLGIIVLLAVIAVIVTTVWINSYLHSDAFRQEVQTRATQQVGVPVEIKQIDWGLLSGVKVDGLATKVGTPQGPVSVEVDSIRCSYSLMELLSKRLHVGSVTIEKPHIVLTEQPASRLTRPSAPATKPSEGQATVPPNLPLEVLLDAVKVSDGEISIQDSAGKPKADLHGVAMTANTSGFFQGRDVTGFLTIASVALPTTASITNFSTPFTYRPDTMTAGPFQVTAFAGEIRGDYKLDPSGPSLLNLTMQGLDMLQVGQAADPASPTKLSGSLNLQSKWSKIETGAPAGEGDLQISNGKLEGDPLLHDLADAFRIPEMSDPDLKSVTTHFEAADGTTHFSNLQIASTVFDMTGQGTIDPQGNLSADMTMILHPDAFKRIPSIAVSFFTKLPDGGGSIPFHLSGTAKKPVSDLTTQIFINGSKIHKSIKKTFDKIFN